METIGNKKDIEKLVGKKVTLFIMSDFGFPSSHQVTLKSFALKPYAQYAEVIKLTFRKPRQRKDRGTIIFNNTYFAIYEGWINLKDDMFTDTKKENGMIIRTSAPCFDSSYVETALNSTEQKPVYTQK